MQVYFSERFLKWFNNKDAIDLSKKGLAVMETIINIILRVHYMILYSIILDYTILDYTILYHIIYMSAQYRTRSRGRACVLDPAGPTRPAGLARTRLTSLTRAGPFPGWMQHLSSRLAAASRQGLERCSLSTDHMQMQHTRGPDAAHAAYSI